MEKETIRYATSRMLQTTIQLMLQKLLMTNPHCGGAHTSRGG